MSDALETKIDGLRESFDVKIAALERMQNGFAAWMERLSGSVEKLSDMAGPIHAMQAELGAVKATQTDMALDIDALDSRMSDIEEKDKAQAWFRRIVIAVISSISGAGIAYFVPKIIEHFPKG